MSSNADRMRAASLGRHHLLDPLDADDDSPPDDYRRINLRRVQLGATIMVFDALVEAGFNLVRQSTGLWILAAVAATGAVFFAIAARRAQKRHSPADNALIEGFVVFALLCSDAAGYFVAQSGRIPSGYAMLYLAISAFFSIPPRRFAVIGALTFLLFLAWVSVLPVALFEKLVALFNTGLAVIAGIFGRWSIDRVQQLSRAHRVRIAQQNAALMEANALLARRNGELNELMAIAAHDLRSPLFGLRSVLDLAIGRPPESPGALRDLLGAANRSIAGMLALIGRLLEAHAVEGRASPAPCRRDIAHCLSAALRRAAPHAEACGVSLAAGNAMPRHPVWALVDAEGLDQILDNLLSNAIRFSPTGTTVRASVGIMAGTPFIEIADQGLGIPEAERSLLFAKFSRGSAHPVHGSRGSGLGLYIVRTLAEGMEARCSFRSAEPSGSVFRLEFAPEAFSPRARHHMAARNGRS